MNEAEKAIYKEKSNELLLLTLAFIESGLRDEKTQKAQIPLKAELDELAKAVLSRELGIAPGVVIDIEGALGWLATLEVEEVGFLENYDAWSISGTQINRSTGLSLNRKKRVTLAHASIMKRNTNGVWEEIVRSQAINDKWVTQELARIEAGRMPQYVESFLAKREVSGKRK